METASEAREDAHKYCFRVKFVYEISNRRHKSYLSEKSESMHQQRPQWTTTATRAKEHNNVIVFRGSCRCGSIMLHMIYSIIIKPKTTLRYSVLMNMGPCNSTQMAITIHFPNICVSHFNFFFYSASCVAWFAALRVCIFCTFGPILY